MVRVHLLVPVLESGQLLVDTQVHGIWGLLMQNIAARCRVYPAGQWT